MKNYLRNSVLALVLCASPMALEAAPPPHVPGEVVIKFRTSAKDDEIGEGLKLGKLKVKKNVASKAAENEADEGVLTLAETDIDVGEVVKKLKGHPAVEYVEPNYTYSHQATANDQYVSSGVLWGVYGDLSSPANTYGSQAAEAWAAGYTGSRSVYVGVIDEGVQVSHPDLSPNIWTNPFDPVDGLDNDRNGYVDDVNGWDFFNNRKEVYDPATGDTHGTHVAGTIGAAGGNSIGIAGINWNVTMISAKFMSGGSGTTFGAVAAINYFIDLKTRHGLDVVAINASWGGTGYSQSLHDAVIRAAKAGIVFVAAAGNAGLNNDSNNFFPANIDTTVPTSTQSAAPFNGVISVAAIDKTGALAPFSNYGAKKVHIGAPGVGILSTYKGSYAYMNGTSMAAPHVAGAAALYASSHPEADASQIRQAILGASVSTPSLANKTSTGARLDLSSIVVPLPKAPTGLKATAGDAVVSLQWGAVQSASGYVVERATSSGGPYTAIASNHGTTSFLDKAVVNGSTYFYRVAARNVAGAGAASAVASASPVAPVALPTAPWGLYITRELSTVAGIMEVSLRWKPSAGATSYKIEKSLSRTGPWTTVATGVQDTSFVTRVPVDGKSWFYTITGVNASGASPQSPATGVNLMRPTPVLLKATPASSTTATLSWEDRSSDETGFAIEYYNGSSWVVLGIAPANTTVVTLTGVAAKTSYYFRIRAVNQAAATAYSPVARLDMP